VALEQINAAYSMGASKWQVIWHVIIPAAMPEILTGMRIAIGFGWTTLVAAEMVAATAGLGQMVLNASNFLRTDVVIMGIVVIGVVAYLFDLLMRWVELKAVPWKGGSDPGPEKRDIERRIRPQAAPGRHRRRTRVVDWLRASRRRDVRRNVRGRCRRVLVGPGALARKGRQLGIPEGRAYGSAAELYASEKQRADGVDAIAVMTPNDSHYPDSAAALDAGFDVVCDKPITTTLAEAQDLARRIERGKPRVLHHAWLLRVSDDTVCALDRARRNARADSTRAGRIHPERHGGEARGRAADQSPRVDPRSGAQRARAGDGRDRLSTHSTWPASRSIRKSVKSAPMSAR
jgi:hypothetical protein